MPGCQVPHFGLKRQYKNIKAELLYATDQALREGCLMAGKFTSEFEDWLKLRTGCAYAITVHSGTQALEMLARYERDLFSPQDKLTPKILVPNLTYPATLNAFITAGWDIELCDTDKNGLIDASQSSSGDYTCFVGLYGAPATYNFSTGVIVDGAQHWLVADGNVGEGMAISFDPTKNLPSSGNGGAVVTHSLDLYNYIRSYRDNSKNEFSSIGTNSKMSELDCAHLLVRSKYIDLWQARRKDIRIHYLNELANVPVRCLSRGFRVHADQKFVIYTEDRNALYTYLTSHGIETKIHYDRALSELPVTANMTKPTKLSTSVILSRGVLSLPIYPELSDIEIDFIIAKIKDFFAK